MILGDSDTGGPSLGEWARKRDYRMINEIPDSFILNDYGRLPELVKLFESGRSFSIFVPRTYPRYAAVVRLVNERFESKKTSKWESIKDSWSVGKDFSFFSLGFNNDRYYAERVEQEGGMLVRFRPR